MNLKVESSDAATAFRVGGEPGIGGLTGATPETETKAADAAGPDGVSFESVLGNLVGQANAQDHVAGAKAEALATGRLDDLHGTMIAMKEADISMKLVGTVRNKLLDAFHELWRTTV